MVAPCHFSLIMIVPTHSFLVKISASSLLLFQTEKRFRNADVVFLLVIKSMLRRLRQWGKGRTGDKGGRGR
jgi:hypothetical protein